MSSQRDYDQSARYLEDQGRLHFKQRDYQEAIRNYQNAVDVYERKNMGSDQARCLSKIGKAYYRLEDFELSKEFTQRALDIHQSDRGQTDAEAYCHYQIADALSRLGEFEQALERYKQALGLFSSLPNQNIKVANCTEQIAIRQQDLGNWEEAQYGLNGALQLYRQFGDHFDIANCMYNLGNWHYKKPAADYDGALTNYQDSFEMFSTVIQEPNHICLARCLRQIAKIHYHRNNNQEARGYFEQALEMFENLNENDERVVLHRTACNEYLRLIHNRLQEHYNQRVEELCQRFHLNHADLLD